MEDNLHLPIKEEAMDDLDSKIWMDSNNNESGDPLGSQPKALVLSLKRQHDGDSGDSGDLCDNDDIKQESSSPLTSSNESRWQHWPPHHTTLSSQAAEGSLDNTLNFSGNEDFADARRFGEAAMKRSRRVRLPTQDASKSPLHIFMRLLDYPEIIHSIGTYLEIEQLFSLYCVSKDFHRLVNTRFSSTIMAQALSKCPESAAIFHYKMYDRLCIFDPALNIKYTHPGSIRDVPSFRWLRMVLLREKVVTDIFDLLRVQGHRLPRQTMQSMKKIWHLMDFPDNRRRVGLIHNSSIWSNRDIFLSTMFFIKLDMFFNDPIRGNGSTEVRQMMMGQRTLGVLWDVMSRKMMLNHYDMMLMQAEWCWNLRPDEMGQTFFGIPADRIGRLQYEAFRTNERVRLFRPDELVMAESFRRNMRLNDRYMDMILWGYINPRTFENFEIPSPSARKEEERRLLGRGMEDCEIDPQFMERMEGIAEWIGFEKMSIR